jgi:hypothetical protein
MFRFIPSFWPPVNLDVDAQPTKIQFIQTGHSRQFDERHAAATARPHDV